MKDGGEYRVGVGLHGRLVGEDLLVDVRGLLGARLDVGILRAQAGDRQGHSGHSGGELVGPKGRKQSHQASAGIDRRAARGILCGLNSQVPSLIEAGLDVLWQLFEPVVQAFGQALREEIVGFHGVYNEGGGVCVDKVASIAACWEGVWMTKRMDCPGAAAICLL
jgi:hypothetical protein